MERCFAKEGIVRIQLYTWTLILFLFSSVARAEWPQPISIIEPVYAFVPLQNIQLNYQPPYLWVRFSLKTGVGPIAYCYKVNPTVPPAATNGWVSAFTYWSSGMWLPGAAAMTEADKAWCWQ